MPDCERLDAENPDVDRCRAALDLVGADVLAVLNRYTQLIGPYLCACALIHVAGTVCTIVTHEMPDRAAALDAKLAQLRLYVASTSETRQ